VTQEKVPWYSTQESLGIASFYFHDSF